MSVFVRRQLQALDPRVLALLCNTRVDELNVDTLAKDVEEKLQLDENAEDVRMVEAKYGPLKPFGEDLFRVGQKRGSATYAFVLSHGDGSFRIDADGTTHDKIHKHFVDYLDRTGFGTVSHEADLIRAIRFLVECDFVGKFMVGKASHPKNKHVHFSMVNRFKKYQPEGYCAMFGLMLLDGARTPEAELATLQMESRLHYVCKELFPTKFHADLSGATAGALVQGDESDARFFTLYLALSPNVLRL